MSGEQTGAAKDSEEARETECRRETKMPRTKTKSYQIVQNAGKTKRRGNRTIYAGESLTVEELKEVIDAQHSKVSYRVIVVKIDYLGNHKTLEASDSYLYSRSGEGKYVSFRTYPPLVVLDSPTILLLEKILAESRANIKTSAGR